MPKTTNVTKAYLAAKVFGNPMDNPGDFYVRSQSNPATGYWMSTTPEGYAVHQGLGCQSEIFRGPLACWHSRDFSKEIIMTTAVTTVDPSQSLVPVRIDFDSEQLKTIASVICRQGEEVAPASFVQLFIAACRHTGLDPFMKQIWALKIRGNWTVFTGIDGWRTVSQRTGLDAGMDGPEWSDDGETWYDYPFTVKPKMCRVGIWRKGVPRPYVATVMMAVKFNDKSDSWNKDPCGMLAISAERLARRRAFPADTSVLADFETEVFDDEAGAPMTRAEVPEGQYRELPEGFGQPDGSKVPAQVEHEKGIIKDLNLDTDRERAKTDAVVATANQKAEKAAEKAQTIQRTVKVRKTNEPTPEAPVAPDGDSDAPPPLQEQYDGAFREALEAKAAEEQAKAEKQFAQQRAAEFAGGDVVARPEPPEGKPQNIPNPPATKAQEMSAFWVAAKKFEPDTGKIIAASKQHFGGAPAELEGIRRAQLIHLLETGELPAEEEAAEPDHDAVPAYTEDGVMVCEVCESKLDEETGKHV